MLYTDFIARLTVTDTTTDGLLAQCPAHADTGKPHLLVSITDTGKVLIKCRIGCTTEAVLAALGLTLRDLATLDTTDAPTTGRKASAAAPAGTSDIAAMAVQLDGYAEALLAGSPDAEAALAYARDRFGVELADAERLGLGVTFAGGSSRLVVPFRTPEGVARNYQGRALNGSAQVRWLGPKSPTGASWSKVGWFPGAASWDEVIVAEGPGDSLTASVLGYDTVGIAGAGLASSDVIAQELTSWVGQRPVVICGDGDGAGRRFSATLAEKLVAAGVSVRVLQLPDGKDLTDWRGQDQDFARTFTRAIADTQPLATAEAALLAWDESRFSLSDLGGARYLREYIEAEGSGVRYSAAVGFLLLEDGIWTVDNQQRIRTHAQAVADRVRGIASELLKSAETTPDGSPERKQASRFSRYAAHAQASNGMNNMVRELQALPGVAVDMNEFDRQEHLLAFTNGVVDLRTGELQPLTAGLMLTKRMDFDYDPTATAPRWTRFLEECHPDDPEMPGYLQRLWGYGITGSTAEACFAVHHGPQGANGKSTALELLTDIASAFTVTTAYSTFEEKQGGGASSEIAALRGARLVMASEGNVGRPMDEAQIKRLTGGDTISARQLYKEAFTFKPRFLMNLATNHRPAFRGQDGGLWRRVKLITWSRHFAPEERDHRLGEKLRAEKQGIATWLVQGAMAWYAGGLQDPASIVEAGATYKATSDALAGFFPGTYVQGEGRVSGAEMFIAYCGWARDENLPLREVWTRRTFLSAMEERGLRKVKTAAGVAFDGVRLATAEDRLAMADDAPVAAPVAPAAAAVSAPVQQPVDLFSVYTVTPAAAAVSAPVPVDTIAVY